MKLFNLTAPYSSLEAGTIMYETDPEVKDPLVAGLNPDNIPCKELIDGDDTVYSIPSGVLEDITNRVNTDLILPKDIVTIDPDVAKNNGLPATHFVVTAVESSTDPYGDAVTILDSTESAYVMNSLFLKLVKRVGKRLPQANVLCNPNILHKELKKKFVKCKEFAFAFAAAYNTKKNIVFYGPGGHGKSEMVMEIFRIMKDVMKIINDDPFVQTCGKALTSEKLFGGMKNVQDALQGNFNVENSFMNHKYVVFEELFDSDIEALLDLKDPLTSGIFRNGIQTFRMKTEMIIVLTNRTREEISEDDSTKALMERFPLEMKVEWENYNSMAFRQLFQKVYSDECGTLSDLIAKEHSKGNKISPRSAIHAYETMRVNGIEALAFSSGFSSDIVKEAIELEEKNRKVAEALKVLKDAKKEKEELANQIKTIKDYNKILGISVKLRDLKTKLEGLPQDDSHFNEAADMIASLTNLAESAKERAVVLIEQQGGINSDGTFTPKSPKDSSKDDKDLPF